MSKTSSKTDSKNPRDFVIEGDGYADITLTKPRAFDGVEKAVIRMREPTVEDIETFQGAPESSREINTIANLCECSPEDIRKLTLRDYVRFQVAFSLFTA